MRGRMEWGGGEGGGREGGKEIGAYLAAVKHDHLLVLWN